MALLIVPVAVLAGVAVLVFGGFHVWARQQGLLSPGDPGRGGGPAGDGGAGDVVAGKPATTRMSLVTEAVAYIGAILVIAGGVAAIGQHWGSLGTWGHVGVFAGASLFFLLAGIIAGRVAEPAIQRLTGVLWLVSTVGVAGTAGYVTSGLILRPAGPGTGQATVLGIGLAVTAYAAALWWIRRRALQNTALFIGLIILGCGLIATAGRGSAIGTSPLAYSLVLWALGLGWAILGWRRHAEPVWVSLPLGTLLALATPGIAAGEYGWMYATGIVTAAAAMAASVPLRNAVLLAIGTIAMFGYVTSAAVTYLHASLGVPATLSVTGLMIIGLAVATARLMRATRGPRS